MTEADQMTEAINAEALFYQKDIQRWEKQAYQIQSTVLSLQHPGSQEQVIVLEELGQSYFCYIWQEG